MAKNANKNTHTIYHIVMRMLQCYSRYYLTLLIIQMKSNSGNVNLIIFNTRQDVIWNIQTNFTCYYNLQPDRTINIEKVSKRISKINYESFLVILTKLIGFEETNNGKRLTLPDAVEMDTLVVFRDYVNDFQVTFVLGESLMVHVCDPSGLSNVHWPRLLVCLCLSFFFLFSFFSF